MVSQATTEAVLLRRLTDLGVPVHRPTRLTGLTQTDALATATFADGATITANWVVGADGMHSTVREHTGIAFSGAAYPESFLLADVTLQPGPPGPKRGPSGRRGLRHGPRLQQLLVPAAGAAAATSRAGPGASLCCEAVSSAVRTPTGNKLLETEDVCW
jgi:2-polyprenyl-6-methoxyphenol hydroxylase-like FAD-dependent oxidoreductase